MNEENVSPADKRGLLYSAKRKRRARGYSSEKSLKP